MTETRVEAARIRYNVHIAEHGCCTVDCADARRLWHEYLDAVAAPREVLPG